MNKPKIYEELNELEEKLDGKADKTQLDEKENKGAVRSVNGVAPDATGNIDGVGYPTNLKVDMPAQDGGVYTAPANGYFAAGCVSLDHAWLHLENISVLMGNTAYEQYSGASLYSFIPVRTGQQVRLNYTNIGSWFYFTFVYGV